jgi:hypothetical protein
VRVASHRVRGSQSRGGESDAVERRDWLRGVLPRGCPGSTVVGAGHHPGGQDIVHSTLTRMCGLCERPRLNKPHTRLEAFLREARRGGDATCESRITRGEGVPVAWECERSQRLAMRKREGDRVDREGDRSPCCGKPEQGRAVR